MSSSQSGSSQADSDEGPAKGNPYPADTTPWTWWEIFNLLTGEVSSAPTVFRSYRDLGFLTYFFEQFHEKPEPQDDKDMEWSFEDYYPHEKMFLVLARYGQDLEPHLKAAHKACIAAKEALDELSPNKWEGKFPDEARVQEVVLGVQTVLINVNKIHMHLKKVKEIKDNDTNGLWD